MDFMLYWLSELTHLYNFVYSSVSYFALLVKNPNKSGTDIFKLFKCLQFLFLWDYFLPGIYRVWMSSSQMMDKYKKMQ